MSTTDDAAVRSLAGGFLGLAVHQRRYGGRSASLNLYRPLSRLPAHSHEHSYVSFVLAGCFRETCGGDSVECTAGTLIFHPAREVHADSFAPRGARVFSVELAPDWTPGAAARQVVRGGRTFLLGLGLHRRLELDDGLAGLHAEEFAHALGVELRHLRRLPAREARSAWLRRATDFLRASYAEPWSLAAIARHAGVHPVHLARQFRRVHHCTVGDFIRRLRLQRAAELLLDTDEPISQVAAACGFADQSHLTRLLRSCIGTTPAQLRAGLSSGRQG